MKTLYLITGPSGIGKSTIARMVATGIKKSMLIEGDSIYNMVVGSYVPPYKDGNHLKFFWKNVFFLIKSGFAEGYDVVLDYIIYKNSIKRIADEFKDCKIKFIVLTATKADIMARNKMRAFENQMAQGRIQEQLIEFEQQRFDEKYSLDTNNLTANESAKVILKDERFLLT